MALIIRFSENSEKELQKIITNYQEHESYDSEEYPLGLSTKDHYESEAKFAQNLLNQLANLNTDNLSENDLISYKLFIVVSIFAIILCFFCFCSNNDLTL